MRATRIYQQLTQSLKKHSGPLSVEEFLNLVPANKTTIYRQLKKMVRLGVVLEVDLGDGKKRYELKSPNNHHHHLICDGCHLIRCVDFAQDVEIQEQELSHNFQFQITSHRLEFFGFCRRCQTYA